jgi:hypothetical protein
MGRIGLFDAKLERIPDQFAVLDRLLVPVDVKLATTYIPGLHRCSELSSSTRTNAATDPSQILIVFCSSPASIVANFSRIARHVPVVRRCWREFGLQLFQTLVFCVIRKIEILTRIQISLLEEIYTSPIKNERNHRKLGCLGSERKE